jgi:hypothetical protein
MRAASLIPNSLPRHDTPDILSSSPHHDEPTTPDMSLARARITHLLRTRDPVRLMGCLTQSPDLYKLVASLPRATFLEILRVLDPSHFIPPYKEADRFLQPYSMTQPFPHNRSLDTLFKRPEIQKRFNAFIRQVNRIISVRREGGHPLRIAEYSYLLNCARLMGDNYMASEVWSSMQSAGVAPDTTCFNNFMEAKCWGQAYFYEEREPENLRVIPLNYNKRVLPLEERPVGFRGYRTGPQGLLPEIMGIFKSMVERGEPADLGTFTHLMTALGREGDIGGVKKILRDAWNINVDDILAFDGSAPEDANPDLVPKQLSPSSPLFPSTRLLFIVAHVFCINNDCAAAMRLVDFISRHYSIPIPLELWEHLMVWTYTLSNRWSTAMRKQGHSNPVAKPVVWDLWQTMRGEPYNVVPTMPLYHHVLMSLAMRHHYHLMLHVMREARPMYTNTDLKRYDAVKKHIREDRKNNGVVSPTTQRNAELAVMENQEAYRFLQKWVNFILKGRRFPGRRDREFQLRAFPLLIKEWSRFLRPRVIVQTLDFTVELQRDQVRVAFEEDRRQLLQDILPHVEPESSIFMLGQSLKASPDEEFL